MVALAAQGHHSALSTEQAGVKQGHLETPCIGEVTKHSHPNIKHLLITFTALQQNFCHVG